jgi:hypothetical protein
VALDTYFRGNSQEVEFCKAVKAGGNHLVAATAGGLPLAEDVNLRLRRRELGAALSEFHRLSQSQRQVTLEDPALATPPQRPVPQPPEGGLIVRGYCTYMKQAEGGRVERSTEYYYKENPDRWAAETQSDMLWLTRDEWRSLVPDDPRPETTRDIPEPIQRRFYSTIGIDYMEGSVNSLPPRLMQMTLTVERVTADTIQMRLDGYGEMGKPFDLEQRSKPHSRGCELRVLGYLEYDRTQQALVRFDLVGVGQAWGNKMEYLGREIRVAPYPWMYGIACELVTGDAPIDRIPPYNLLHYGSAGPYFATSSDAR